MPTCDSQLKTARATSRGNPPAPGTSYLASMASAREPSPREGKGGNLRIARKRSYLLTTALRIFIARIMPLLIRICSFFEIPCSRNHVTSQNARNTHNISHESLQAVSARVPGFWWRQPQAPFWKALGPKARHLKRMAAPGQELLSHGEKYIF